MKLLAPTRLISGPLQTERLPDGSRQLIRDLVLDIEGESFTVPNGTTTDFSSIPWFGRVLVRWSKVDIAGVVHDWLYQEGSVSRSRADDIWRLVAIAGDHRANFLQAWIAWFFLRLGGWYAWYRHRQSEQKSVTT